MEIAKIGFLVTNEVLQAISCVPASKNFRPDPHQAHIDITPFILKEAYGFATVLDRCALKMGWQDFNILS